MRTLAPVINEARRSGRRQLAFISAVVSLVASFAAAAAPIPLYNIYRAEDAFTNAGISMAVATYSVGAIVGLLVLGRLSNHLGRRPTAIASLGLLLLGCLLLLNVHDIDILLAGRLLMGVGTGLASSSLTSYIVDAAPSRPEWLASVASSQGPMLGLTVGAIASGALVQFGPWPRDLIYLVCAGFLLLSAVLIAISPETATPTPGAWRSLFPRVRVPARVRHLLPVATAVFLATWATGAFYQAFVPALIQDQLHTRSPFILGLVLAAYMAPSVLGAPIGGRFTSRGSPTRRHDHLPGRNDRHHHSDQHRHAGAIHHRNDRCQHHPVHRYQRRHPRAAARQHASRPGTNIQRDLPRLLRRRHLPQPHLQQTFQHLLAAADRLRIRGTCPRRHPVHCSRCTQSAHRHEREQHPATARLPPVHHCREQCHGESSVSQASPHQDRL